MRERVGRMRERVGRMREDEIEWRQRCGEDEGNEEDKQNERV